MNRRGLHAVSPLVNLAFLLILVAAVLASESLAVRAGVVGLVVVLAGLSGISPGRFLRRTRFILLFTVFLFAVQAVSIRTGSPILTSPVRLTIDGVLAGAGMALRFLAILTGSLLFVWVTDPDRLAQGLIRLGVPYRYGYLLILALRFVPFFHAELRTVREAQRVRGIDPKIRSPRGILRAVRYTFLPILVSAMTRVDDIAISMKGRCFGLHPKRTTSRSTGWTAADGWMLLLIVGILGVTIVSRIGGLP
jgi:energy-coupling factor transport system permease protein